MSLHPKTLAALEAGPVKDETRGAESGTVRRCCCSHPPKGEAVSDTPLNEVLAEMAGGVPLDPMPKTHYADPDTLATLARLERENADPRSDIERHVKIASEQATELADLRTKLEAAQRDAACFQWGVKNARWIRHEHEAYVAIPVARDADLSCVMTRLLAIDAAMQEGK